MGLKTELRKIQVEFASLLQHVYGSLAQNNDVPGVKKLSVFLSQRCVDENNEIPGFSEFMTDIVKKSTYEQIFVHMSRIGAWYFLSYLLLKEIIEFYRSNDQDLSQHIEKYDEDVEQFKQKTLLMDFLAIWRGRCDKDTDLPYCRSVIVKLIANPASFTIADACERANLIAGEFSLKDLGKMGNGASGSVYIRWLAPAAATERILKIMKGDKKPDLLKLGVLQLAVERTVFTVRKLAITYPSIKIVQYSTLILNVATVPI